MPDTLPPTHIDLPTTVPPGMSQMQAPSPATPSVHSGLAAVARVAGFHRISADPVQLSHQLGLAGRAPASEDLVRAARLAGLKARVVHKMNPARLQKAPTPAIVTLHDGGFAIFGGMDAQGRFRVIEPLSQHLQLRIPT